MLISRHWCVYLDLFGALRNRYRPREAAIGVRAQAQRAFPTIFKLTRVRSKVENCAAGRNVKAIYDARSSATRVAGNVSDNLILYTIARELRAPENSSLVGFALESRSSALSVLSAKVGNRIGELKVEILSSTIAAGEKRYDSRRAARHEQTSANCFRGGKQTEGSLVGSRNYSFFSRGCARRTARPSAPAESREN